MEFYATLPPGLEDVAAEELIELGASVKELRSGKGRVFFETRCENVRKLNLWSRCTERFVLLMYRGKLSSLDDVYSAIRSLDFRFVEGKTFAIRSMRAGVHDFTSIDVARVAGQAVIDSFMERYGDRLRVNLNEPDVIIRVDVVEDEFFVGVDTTGDDALHKRWWRVYNHPAHLNPAIACAMLRLAGWKRERVGREVRMLVDPMCGSGTIPIEAALIALNVPPGKNRDFAFFKLCDTQTPEEFEVSSEVESKGRFEIHGVEKFRKHVEGAMENAKSAGVSDFVKIRVGDATRLEGVYDCIVTNPPYGLRIARKGLIKKLYDGLCGAMKRCMHENSRAVVITAEHRLMKESAEKAGLSVEHERFVKYGGLITKVLVFTL